VAAGAKIFTGYIVQGVRSSTQNQVTSQFMAPLHDNSSKVLSYHFNNQVVNAVGATEYANYIDIVFNQPDTATYICRKLYRYFVNCDITAWVEQNIITDMAQTFVANNFEITPVLVELFSSAHFYDISVRGAIIRSPLETLCAMLNTSSTTANFDLQTTYQIYLSMYGLADQMGQGYAAPPSVAGWTPYYQAPAFYRLWINSTYIKKRFDAAGQEQRDLVGPKADPGVKAAVETSESTLKTARIRAIFNAYHEMEQIDFTDSNVESTFRFYGFIGNRQPNTEIDNIIYQNREMKRVMRENLNQYEIITDPSTVRQFATKPGA
jgi:uncharacterized protein (DUF1800 family)